MDLTPHKKRKLSCPKKKGTWNVLSFWEKDAKNKFSQNQKFLIGNLSKGKCSK
jgi:hypothetical protein